VLRAQQWSVGEQLVSLARERGELAGTVDPDLVVDLIVGPLYWRLAISRTPLSGNDLRRMAAASTAALESLCEAAPAAPVAPQRMHVVS
jgi:hypothetical protein